MHSKLVLGGPGTGKTTHLMGEIERFLQMGISPERIAFCSFTNAAADEGRKRAVSRFDIDPKSFPHFRTIHSLAFQQMNANMESVLINERLKEFSEYISEEITVTKTRDIEDESTGHKRGDIFLGLINMARAKKIDLYTAWEQSSNDLDVGYQELLRFSRGLDQFKATHGLVDFADMLDEYAESGMPLSVDVAIIDEAQDMSARQWAVINRAFENSPTIIYAGDDDQAINVWAGADVNKFLSLETDEKVVLPYSYRVPAAVHNFGLRVLTRIKHRYDKLWSPNGQPGIAEWAPEPEAVPIPFIPGSWLLLARTRRSLPRLERICRNAGLLYTVNDLDSVDALDVDAINAWESLRNNEAVPKERAQPALMLAGLYFEFDIEKRYISRDDVPEIDKFRLPWYRALKGLGRSTISYYLAIIERGHRLDDPPQITISTIHHAKGREADNVLLMTDTTAFSDLDCARTSWATDEEHRVFFVGVTRARQRLFLIEPQGHNGYQL